MQNFFTRAVGLNVYLTLHDSFIKEYYFNFITLIYNSWIHFAYGKHNDFPYKSFIEKIEGSDIYSGLSIKHCYLKNSKANALLYRKSKYQHIEYQSILTNKDNRKGLKQDVFDLFQFQKIYASLLADL